MIRTCAGVFDLPATNAPPAHALDCAPFPVPPAVAGRAGRHHRAAHCAAGSLARLALLLLVCIGSLASAGAQTSTSFDFSKPEIGGFLSAGQDVSLYGEASYYTTYDIHKFDRPPISRALQLTPSIDSPSADDNGARFGAAYYSQPADLSKGFDTTFYVGALSSQGFAFLIKNVNETRALNISGGDLGYNDFYRSIAVVFDAQSQRISLEAPVNDRLNEAVKVLAAATFPDPPHGYRSPFLGHVAMRYSPRSKVFDVYVENKLVLRATDFSFDDYQILQDGKATVGFVGLSQPTRDPKGGYDASNFNFINTWQFGNNLDTFGINDSYFSQLMTFQTKGQSLWGSGTGSVSWDSGNKYLTTYTKSISKKDSKSGFSGEFNAQFDNNGAANGIGLRFAANASGGNTDITYPLYLGLLFPKQQTIATGEKFQIASSYAPDYTAAFTTSSPSAGVQAFLSLNTHNHADYKIGFPFPFDFLNSGGTLLDFNTKVNDVKVFDTDFILQNASLFGIVAGAAGQAVSLQDDEGVKGPKSTHRGNPGEGSTKGAGKGVNPLQFINLNLFLPNLGTSGSVPFGVKSATGLTGSAQSDILGIHSDLTNALLDVIGLGELAWLLNSDFSFSVSGQQYALGWHFADLYCDLNLGVQLTHQFTPSPHVRLHFTDLNGKQALDTNGIPLRDVEYDLHDDRTPTDSPTIPMTQQPLVVTPTVYLANPKAGALPSYNTFSTTAALTIGGDLGLNAFQMYLKIPGVVDLDTGPIGYTWSPSTVINGAGGTRQFEMRGFNVVTGASFTLLPKDSTNPLIVSATPISGLHARDSRDSIELTLRCTGASADAGVVWDRGLDTETVLQASGFKDSVNGNVDATVTIPNSLRLQRGSHTLTVINGIDLHNVEDRHPSNAVTYTLEEFAPSLDQTSPNLIALTTPPIDQRTQAPILQDGPKGDNGMTEQYFTLTVKGKDFVDALPALSGSALPGSVVRWNGQNLPTTFVSVTQLQARVPAAFISKTGQAQITVFNALPGGGESSAQTVTLVTPTPAAARLSPSTSFAGAARMTTMVYGSSFTRASQVLWNGSPRPTTFFSSTQLEAQLDDADTAAAGTGLISVTNGAGLNSQVLKFTTGVQPVRTILQITPTLKRDAGDNSVLVTLTIKNIGSSTAQGLAVGSLTITGAGSKTFTGQADAPAALPQGMGDLAPGQSVTMRYVVPGQTTTMPVAVRFAADSGASGAAVLLNISGSFSDGPFTAKQRVILP